MTKRKSLIALFTMGLSALALTLAGSPAQAAVGWHPIDLIGSSHCLDEATENIYKLQMWDCSGALEQNWQVTQSPNPLYQTISNQRYGLCITGPAGLTGPVTMDFCTDGNPRQEWETLFYPNTNELVEYRDTPYCLTTSSVKNGTVPQVVPCDNEADYQMWVQKG
jgi:Ricin-type beta-trefoil lectin domain